jgi:hypothetical protein
MLPMLLVLRLLLPHPQPPPVWEHLVVKLLPLLPPLLTLTEIMTEYMTLEPTNTTTKKRRRSLEYVIEL